MPSAVKLLRAVMGLPQDQGERSGERMKKKGDVPADSVRLWEAAGRELAQHPTALPSAVPPVVSAAPPWTPQTEKSGVRVMQRLGRGVLWGVVALAAVTGVRAWVVPPKAAVLPAAPTTPGPTYPVADAQAAAAVFARAYLGWDSEHPQARAAVLAALLPPASDTAMGWNGRGRQEVLAVQPAAVTVGQHEEALVRVLALVRSAAASAGGSESAAWIALDVPVVQNAGRITVTGEPGLVGVPAQGAPAQNRPATPTDSAMSAATQTVVEQFLKSYAAAPAVSGSASGGSTTQAPPAATTATAPGANIPPLPAGFAYSGLTSWTVDTGDGESRTGTARVSWTVAGAVIEQTYRVVLTRVSSVSAQTWQVADIRGGSL